MKEMHFDKNGKAVTFDEWCQLFQNREYKRVAWDALPDGGHLSTVWLGLDHGWGGRTLIFESMSFHEGDRVGVCERYSTLQEALDGHERLLLELNKLPQADGAGESRH